MAGFHSVSMAEWDSVLCIFYIVFIHSFISGHLGCFRVLAVANNAAVSIGLQRMCTLWICVFTFFRQICRSGIAGPYSSSLLSFLESPHSLFSLVATPVYILTNSTQEFPFLHPLQYLFPVFSLVSILTGVRWYLIVVLIWISLIIVMLTMLSCAFWLSVCLLEKCLFRSSPHFLIGLLSLSYMSSLYIFGINVCLNVSFANNFSHSVGCFFFSFFFY